MILVEGGRLESGGEASRSEVSTVCEREEETRVNLGVGGLNWRGARNTPRDSRPGKIVTWKSDE